jgi:predicted nucleic acid-binding protein
LNPCPRKRCAANALRVPEAQHTITGPSQSSSLARSLVSRLGRPKFDRYRETEVWNLFLSELVELAIWLEDAGTASGICRDADDDMFLAPAAAGSSR